MMLFFYVEEPSAEAALIELVPRILEGRQYEYDFFVFQGKENLLRELPKRLKAYRHHPGDFRVIVLVDRDQEDCSPLKQRLDQIAGDAGLVTRTASLEQFVVLNRIAIEELEAWFFGDLEAMRKAYPRLDPHLDKQAAFRDPDAIKGGTAEQLEKLLKTYHPGGLEKIRAATEIAAQMEPDRNRSRSFQVFRDGLRRMFG